MLKYTEHNSDQVDFQLTDRYSTASLGLSELFYWILIWFCK